jgi:transcriptional antiterminator RfaH
MEWYAIYTKPKCEGSTARQLENAGIEVLNPRVRTKKFKKGRYEYVVEPLFKNYVFASFDNDKHNHMIRYTRGVKYIVGKENPVIVPREIIDAIKERMVEGGLIIPAKENFEKGDRVKIHEGPFSDFYGIFDREVSGRERVMILLEALHCRIEIESSALRKV